MEFSTIIFFVVFDLIFPPLIPRDPPRQRSVTIVFSEAMATDREGVYLSLVDPLPYIATEAPRLTEPQVHLRGGKKGAWHLSIVTLLTLTKAQLRQGFVLLRCSIGQRASRAFDYSRHYQ